MYGKGAARQGRPVRDDTVTGGDSVENAPGGHVDIRILGPLEAISEARSFALKGGKQKSLLALLLLHSDRGCNTHARS